MTLIEISSFEGFPQVLDHMVDAQTIAVVQQPMRNPYVVINMVTNTGNPNPIPN